jgi:hypothetical protein
LPGFNLMSLLDNEDHAAEVHCELESDGEQGVGVEDVRHGSLLGEEFERPRARDEQEASCQ